MGKKWRQEGRRYGTKTQRGGKRGFCISSPSVFFYVLVCTCDFSFLNRCTCVVGLCVKEPSVIIMQPVMLNSHSETLYCLFYLSLMKLYLTLF